MTPIATPLQDQYHFGLAEASRATGKSVSTLRRKKRELLERGASITEKGWRIPASALVELGLLDKTTRQDSHPSSAQESNDSNAPGGSIEGVSRDEWKRLVEENTRLRIDNERLRAENTQMGLRIDDLKQAANAIKLIEGLQRPKHHWWNRNKN